MVSGPRMPCFDRCQLTITWMSNIKDVRCKLAGVWPRYGQVILVTLGSLSTHVFETRTTTGREHFASQDSGVSQAFTLIIFNRETILINVNVVV